MIIYLASKYLNGDKKRVAPLSPSETIIPIMKNPNTVPRDTDKTAFILGKITGMMILKARKMS